MRNWVVFALSAIGVAVLLRSPVVDAQGRPPRHVRTARVELREPTPELRFFGVTRAIESAVLSLPAGGRLIEVTAEPGRRVAEGAVLARVDPAPIENAVLEADAELYRAKIQWRRDRRERERTKRLLDVGGRTERDLEEALAAEEAARALVAAAEFRVRQADRMLEDAVLRAPFAGTVGEVLLEAGEHADPGEPIVALSGHSGFEVEVQVPESVVRRIRLRSKVSVEFPMSALDRMRARISSVTYVARREGALFPVVARIEGRDGLMPGMAAEVVFRTGGKLSLLVPVNAVVDPTGQAPAIFRVRDGRAQKIDVEIVGLAGEWVVLRGALEAGQDVIVAGHRGLIDGDSVQVAAPASPHRP